MSCLRKQQEPLIGFECMQASTDFESEAPTPTSCPLSCNGGEVPWLSTMLDKLTNFHTDHPEQVACTNRPWSNYKNPNTNTFLISCRDFVYSLVWITR